MHFFPVTRGAITTQISRADHADPWDAGRGPRAPRSPEGQAHTRCRRPACPPARLSCAFCTAQPGLRSHSLPVAAQRPEGDLENRAVFSFLHSQPSRGLAASSSKLTLGLGKYKETHPPVTLLHFFQPFNFTFPCKNKNLRCVSNSSTIYLFHKKWEEHSPSV